MIINQLRTMDNKEGIMPRISQGFPISIYKTDFSVSPYTPVSWHWHEDFQISWVNKGTVKFQVADQCYILSENMGIFIGCRLAHTAEPETADASYYGINFHPDVICSNINSKIYQEMMLPFMQSYISSIFVFDKNELEGLQLFQASNEILSLSEQYELIGKELLIQSELLHIWPSVYKILQGSNEIISISVNQRLKEILLYIDMHYTEKITLQSIAKQIHISAGECSRFFKKITGITTFEYIIKLRILKSKRLLCTTDMSVADVAQQSGFSSQSYYTICFKKHENCTPNQYRHMS